MGRHVMEFRLVLVLALAAIAGVAWALDPHRQVTQYGLQGWTTAQGLPSNVVNAVHQTKDGYLWLGTEDGLVRFDGFQFTLFDRRTTPAFKVNNITALVETPGGTLFAATNGGGVIRYKDGTFTRFGLEQGLGDERIWAICGDEGEGLWIGTPQNELYRLEGEAVRPASGDLGRAEGGISVLVSAPPGSYGMKAGGPPGLWVGRGRHIGLFSEGRAEPLELPAPLSNSVVTAVLPDGRGRLWVGTNMGAVRLGPGGPKRFTTREGIGNDRIFFISGDRDGNTWIGSYGGGLARITGEDRVAVLTARRGLADDRPLCFCEDRQGAAWIGTRGGGLNRLMGGPATPFTTVEGLSSDQVFTIMQDREGALWLGTGGGGLNRLAGGRISTWGKRDGLSGDSIGALFQDAGGTIWAGAGDGSLNRFDGRRFHAIDFQPGPERFKVSCIAQDRGGALWVGTRGGGLWAWRNGRFEKITEADKPPGWGIYAILFEPDGTMWLGTSEGLYRRTKDRFVACRQEPELGQEKVFGLCRDASGTLWLTTYSGGLVRYRHGRARRITGEHGLGENTFYTALDDGKGSLWLTSNGGIIIAELDNLEAFLDGKAPSVECRRLGLEDGLLTLECNGGGQPAGCLAADGRLWIPTARGAVAIDPAGLAVRGVPPPAQIEAVLLNGQPVSFRAPVSMSRGAGALEIHFSVPGIFDPGGLQVAYRLEGFDREWVAAGRRRTAYYTNVPAGRFVFQVRSEDDKLTGPEATLALHLKPPLYQHPLFLAAMGVLVAAAVVGLHRLRVGLLESRGRLLEETVARRTAELTAEKDRVKALEERYRAVVEGQTEMICRFAPDGTLLFANGALGRLWGRDPESLPGESLFAFLPQKAQQQTRDVLASFAPSEPFRLVEQRVSAVGEEPRIHQWSIRAFFDTEGGVTGFQGVGRDVTEQRRLREQLVQAQKMEAIGLLAGGVAHDFNNLLQAMLTAAASLRHSFADHDRAEAAVGEIEQDIHRAAQLTRQLLLFARRETARPEAVDLNTLVRGVDGLLRRFLRENIVFELDLCEGALPVRADLGHIEQAIVNLVVNACDALSGGGRLDLATGRDGNRFAWFAVRDSGPGIPEELRGRIFEPFFTTKGSEQGTGLGLPVVLGIVQQNGGTIDVGEAPEGGAEFRVALPLMNELLPEALVSHPPRALAQEGPERRILLVEDAVGVRDWLGEALTLLGYRVTAVGSTKDALNVLGDCHFDLVLSDVLLPDGSGVDIARHVATLAPLPALILISGYSRDDVLRKEVMQGNVRFLQKPFGLDALEREMASAFADAGQPAAQSFEF